MMSCLPDLLVELHQQSRHDAKPLVVHIPTSKKITFGCTGLEWGVR